MRIVLQRVESASVAIDGKTVGEINQGLLIFLGVGADDTKEMADKMLNKIKKLRIFADSDDKTNLSIEDIGGEVLVISQFTLYANCKKGNRPSFTQAGNQTLATELYEYFLSICDGQFKKVASGEFGADMKVSLINDGPFTIVLDAAEI